MLKRLLDKILPGDETARAGIVWNIASFAVIGISGIVLNIIIAFFYGSSVLGVFNQVTAYYIIGGQVGAWGLQNAAVYFTPRQKNDEDLGHLLGSLLTATLITSACAAAVIFFSVPTLGEIVYKSAAIKSGLQSIVFAVVLFSINKVLLGFISGMRYMRAFAIIQGLRYIFIILFFLGAVRLGAGAITTTYAFLFSEILLFFIAASFLFKKIRPRRPRKSVFIEGIKFGSKSVVGGIVSELNAKADIMVLGIFTTDSVVGIYSFASLLAEGFASLILVFRNNINPMFARLYFEGDKKGFREIMHQVNRLVLPICAAGGAAICGLFTLLCLFMPNPTYKDAIFPLCIILFCMTVASPAMVKGNVLTHTGKPELDTIITCFAVLFNIIFNLITIPLWGMIGAAIATGASYLLLYILTSATIRKQRLY